MKAIFFNYLMGAGVVLLLLTAVVTTSPASYLYCLSQEASWLEAESRKELEKQLFLYSSDVLPSDRSGKTKVRYRILYKEPMLVTYAQDGGVDDILFEYE